MLILVRHGRTALNAAGKLQGRIDEPLDEVGEAQAVAVAAFVGPVDELISSPLLRAQQTARAFDVPFEVDERWIELSYGIYEGVPHADVPSESVGPLAGRPRVRAGGRRVAAGARPPGPGRLRRASASGRGITTSRSSATCRRSRPLWRGPSTSASRSRGGRTCRSASVCRIDVRPSGPVLYSFNEIAG